MLDSCECKKFMPTKSLRSWSFRLWKPMHGKSLCLKSWNQQNHTVYEFFNLNYITILPIFINWTRVDFTFLIWTKNFEKKTERAHMPKRYCRNYSAHTSDGCAHCAHTFFWSKKHETAAATATAEKDDLILL